MADYSPADKRLLRDNGCYFEHASKDDHEIWHSPLTNRRFPVDSKFLIIAAIEGAGCGRSEAAGGLNLAGEEHKPRLRILSSRALKNFAPDSLGAAEHAGDKLATFVARSGPLRLRRRLPRDVGLWIALQDGAWIDTEEERDEYNRDTADAAAGNTFRHTESATILYVLAFSFVIETHRNPSVNISCSPLNYFTSIKINNPAA